jgi:hypothetical protein
VLTIDILKQYFVEPAKLPKHPFYNRSVIITNKLEAHSKGKYPKDVIEVARPNESFDQVEYRKSVYTPITQTYFSKVVSTISKIGRAEDYKVEWPEQKNIDEEESLKEYLQNNYPNFDSLENWFFSLQLREMCDDPNGVVAVFPYPKINPDDDSEMLRPFTFWFESEDVIDYKEGELAVLRSAEKSIVLENGESAPKGIVYYIFDKDSWTKCVQTGELKDYTFTYDIQPHWIGHLPCLKIGGIIEEFQNDQMLYDSFIGDCIPFWDEALRRYSDQQVQMVLHVHSEKWEVEDTPCKTCSGQGQVIHNYMGGKTGMGTCGTCGGRGTYSPRSPFGVKTIKSSNKVGPSEAANVPIPPMGYIDKPIEQTQFIHDQVQENIKSGLSAINMEFLMFEPEVNSGIAKTLDRQEMNTFFYTIARHIVHNIFRPVDYFVAMWRYGLISSEEDILAILPQRNVPVKYDILTEDILAQRLSNAKTAGLSPSLMAQLEIDYARKEFGDDSLQVDILETIAQLDPLPNKDDQSKMTILSNKGTTLEKYILSCNIQAFVNRAYSENEEFFDLNYAEKMDILNGYVQEVVDSQAAAKVPIVINTAPQNPDEEDEDEENEPNPNNPSIGAEGSDDSALDDTPDGNALPTKTANKPTNKRLNG